MRRRVTAWIWIMGVLLAGGWPGVAAAQEKIELGMNLTPGESATIELLIEQDIQQQVMAQDISMDQIIGMTMRYDVLAPPAGAVGDWVEVTYTRMRFKQNGPMGQIDYDSDAPPAHIPMAARGFSGLVGQSFSMEFSAKGEVINIVGIDDMTARVIDSMDLPEGPAKQAAQDMVKLQVNEESLKQMMSMSSAMFPPGPVAIGDTWDDTQSISGMLPMTVASRFTLVDWDDETATLDTVGTIGPNPDAQPFDLNDVQIDGEMTGTQSGQVVLDRRTGLTRSSTIKQDMEGGMTMLMGNGGAVEIDMAIKGTVTMTLLD